MSDSGVSESDSEDKTTSDGGPGNEGKLSDYEKARLKRIEENKVRMEALGLRRMASSLVDSLQESQKTGYGGKGKRKTGDEDEEYNPGHEEDEMSSSGEEEEDEDDEDFSVSHKKQKQKQKKVKRNTSSTPKKQGSIEKVVSRSDFVDDDDDLMRAIALSLQDSVGLLDVQASPSQSATARCKDVISPKTPTSHNSTDKRKANLKIRDDSGKSKRKAAVSRRVQMSEDEVLVHFFQFDETGIGSFTLRDLQRLAIAHDFTWSEKEMADMITCFDSDKDGKINFDDFRKIACRCNMLKASSNEGDSSL